jgi:hypothetical protein
LLAYLPKILKKSLIVTININPRRKIKPHLTLDPAFDAVKISEST